MSEETQGAFSVVFDGLTGPNWRGCWVLTLSRQPRPSTFLVWNNLCDLVHASHLPKTTRVCILVAFSIPGHVTTEHLLDTALLGPPENATFVIYE